MIQTLTEIRLIGGMLPGAFFSSLILFIVSVITLIRGVFTIKKGKQVREFGTVYNAEILSKRHAFKKSVYVTVRYTDQWGSNKMTEVECYSGTYYKCRKQGWMRIIEFGQETYEYYNAPSVFKGVTQIFGGVMIAATAVYMIIHSRI